MRFERFSKYSVVSGISFGMNFGLTAALCQLMALPEETAFAIALASVFTMNFLFMRHWVYDDRLSTTDGIRQFRFCIIVSCFFRMAEWLSFVLLNWLLVLHYLVILTIVTSGSFTIKFFVYDRLVFASGNTAAGDKRLESNT